MSLLQAARPFELFIPRAAVGVPLGSLWARDHQGSGRAGLIPPPQSWTLDISLRTGRGVSPRGLAGHGQAGARLHWKWLPGAGVSAGRSLPAALQQDGVAPGRASAPVRSSQPDPRRGTLPGSSRRGHVTAGKGCSFARVRRLIPFPRVFPRTRKSFGEHLSFKEPWKQCGILCPKLWSFH